MSPICVERQWGRASPFRGPKQVSCVVVLISKHDQGHSLLRTIRQPHKVNAG